MALANSMELCRICETRKPKRSCPGVGGDICPQCCGAEREVTVDCPLDCEYLLEARRHERPQDVDPDKFPNPEIRVTEGFLRDHADLLVFSARSLLDAAFASGASDFDMRESLDAMIRTLRTAESGLIYQSRPQNPYADAVMQRFNESLDQFRKQLHDSMGMHTIRDSEVLGILVFLQRMELTHNNGRRKGRSFLSFLMQYFPQREEPRVVA
jgi:hypothetical protein